MNHLYWIETKDGTPVRFRMNWAQEELFRGLWTRNNVLKGRQLGISTLIAIYILDGCLFTRNWHAGIIDRTMEDAKEKLRKIAFALGAMMEAPPNGVDWVEDAGDREMIGRFARDVARGAGAKPKEERCSFTTRESWVKVGTTMRGGTLQFLHISEFGSVAANNPAKARQVINGGLNAVKSDCIVVMESTHEGGKRGKNYELTKEAMDMVGKRLTEEDFRFFFFPWWKQPDYRLDGDGEWELTPELAKYFRTLSEEDGIRLDEGQRRWYAKKEAQMGGWVRQEYPSTPAEAFETPVEGAIYGNVISAIRSKGQLAREFEADDNMPLYVSWDLGMQDATAMWLIQPGEDGRFYVLDYYEASGMQQAHYVAKVRAWEAEYEQAVRLNLVPHDGAKRDMVTGLDYLTHLRQQGLICAKVARTPDVWVGIHATRRLLRHCVFHARCGRGHVVEGEEMMSGVEALENYRVAPPGSMGVIREMPLHDGCSHLADAFRTFVEGYEAGYVSRDGTAREEGRRGGERRRVARGVPW